MRYILALVLFSALPLAAQQDVTTTYGPIRTPEIQLGSGSTPTVITVPPVIQTSAATTQTTTSVPPASTEVLSSRHFDYIVSPLPQETVRPGSMADTSISLGEYARRLRAQKQQAASHATPWPASPSRQPAAMAQPPH